jgi:hypothetical protein
MALKRASDSAGRPEKPEKAASTDKKAASVGELTETPEKRPGEQRRGGQRKDPSDGDPVSAPLVKIQRKICCAFSPRLPLCENPSAVLRE